MKYNEKLIQDVIKITLSATRWDLSSVYRREMSSLLSTTELNNIPLMEAVYRIINKVEAAPTCRFCGTPCSFKNAVLGYNDICKSHKCSREKAKETMTREYGSPYTFTMADFKEKASKTFMENYGVDWASKYPDIIEKGKATAIERGSYQSRMEKVKETNKERYGADWYVQTEDFKEKNKQTLFAEYGVTHNLSIPGKRDEVKQTWMETLGVDNPTKSELIREKVRETSRKRFGVDCNMQSAEGAQKNMRACFRRKDVIINGKIFTCQGFEPYAIAVLVESFNFSVDMIENSYTAYPSVFKYNDGDGKIRVYFPDIWLPHCNTFVEVKSEYTVRVDAMLFRKKQVVEDAGYKWALMVINTPRKR